MQNDSSTQQTENQGIDRPEQSMYPVFRSRKNLLKNLLRALLLLAVLGMAIFIFLKLKTKNTPPPLPTLPPAIDTLATIAAQPDTIIFLENTDKLPQNEVNVAPELSKNDTPPSFSALAHQFFKQNRTTTAPPRHPMRQGMRQFENGNFARAAQIFEAVLDSSENERVTAEADFYLLLALLGDCPRSQVAYQQQLDRILEEKNHPKFQQAAALKRAASQIWRRQ